MSIKYKIFLTFFGFFLTITHVSADCIVTSNNFNKSSKIIFVNPNNGSDQLAKTYSLDNVRNPYEANNVAAFQSIEKAKSLADSDNGDLILIKVGPKWTNYQAWQNNKLTDFNKEVMKVKGTSEAQCQGQSLTWVPSAVTDEKLTESTVITDFESKDEVILSSTEEATSISLPNISSKDNISTGTAPSNRAVMNDKRSSGGGTSTGNKSGDSHDLTKSPRLTSNDKLNNYYSNERTNKIAKITHNGEVTYSDSTRIDIKQHSIDGKIEVIDIDSGSANQISNSDSISANGTCRSKSIGVNLTHANYYSSEMTLNDIARYSGGWQRQWNSDFKDVPFSVDENGYITELIDPKGAYAIITDDKWGRDVDEDRNYVLLYDGDGDLSFGLNAPQVISKEPGVLHIKMPANAGRFTLKLKSTSRTNYVRNIRILPESQYEKSTTGYVRDNFKNKWANSSVFRYLDPLETNNSDETQWSDRASESSFGKGKISYEDIIRISNDTNTDPWITIPHMADDDYIRNLAILFKEKLAPSLKVYVEYTNEAWNASFTQYKYLKAKADSLGQSNNIQYGLESKRVFEIWMNVYGTSYRNRIVRVIGAQLVNPWLGSRILDTEGLAETADAIAVGYYIGADTTLSLDGIFEKMLGEKLDEVRSYLRQYKKIADDNGLKLVAYEAGQHLVKPHESSDISNKLIAANRDPRMTEVYTKMYETWKDVGGELIVWYKSTGSYSKWGSWGILESMNQISSPKYDAIKQILSKCD